MGRKSMVIEAIGISPARRVMAMAVVLLGLLVIATASGAAAEAKGKPVAVNATLGVAVTGISDPIPAGVSGRVRIKSEMLAGAVIATDTPELAGAFVSLEQKSNELFSGPLPFGVAVTGSSVGSFSLVAPSGVVANGKYHLSVSNVPGCQILGQGNWSTTGGSNVHGRGTVVSCLNFDFGLGTFVGSVTLAGTLN